MVASKLSVFWVHRTKKYMVCCSPDDIINNITHKWQVKPCLEHMDKNWTVFLKLHTCINKFKETMTFEQRWKKRVGGYLTSYIFWITVRGTYCYIAAFHLFTYYNIVVCKKYIIYSYNLNCINFWDGCHAEKTWRLRVLKDLPGLLTYSVLSWCFSYFIFTIIITTIIAVVIAESNKLCISWTSDGQITFIVKCDALLNIL